MLAIVLCFDFDSTKSKKNEIKLFWMNNMEIVFN